MVVAYNDHSVAQIRKFGAKLCISYKLLGLVMHRPVTENANVGMVIEIGNTPDLHY